MPVEDRPRRIDDRIVAVVAVGQHGVDGGDRPAAAHVGAGTLDQIGQHRNRGRRIAARTGGFAQRQPDLATRMRDAGQRIHDQQHLFALVTKGFGDGGGAQRAADAQHGAVVGGHRDDDGALARLARDLGFQEVGDFAAALADQPDDDNVGLGRLHHHAEQHRLADARPGHDADALALADRQQAVDRAYPDVHRLEYAAAVERRLQLAGERPCPRAADRTQAVDRFARPVDHAAQHRRADLGLAGRSDRPDRRARQQSGGAAQVHQQRAAVAETDHLGLDLAVAMAADLAHRADG